MKPIQVVIRDLFGGVVFNQVFPNLPIAAASISIFFSVWAYPVSQVIILTPKSLYQYDKKVFKFRIEPNGQWLLKSAKGETILLPEPISPEDMEAMGSSLAQSSTYINKE